MEASTDPLFSVRIFKMSNQACFVFLSLSTGWTNTVNAFHVLDEFVWHLEHLLAVVTGQELAAGLVLAGVNAKIELLAKGHLAVVTLESVLSCAEMFISSMILDH